MGIDKITDSGAGVGPAIFKLPTRVLSMLNKSIPEKENIKNALIRDKKKKAGWLVFRIEALLGV